MMDELLGSMVTRTEFQKSFYVKTPSLVTMVPNQARQKRYKKRRLNTIDALVYVWASRSTENTFLSKRSDNKA